MVCKLGQSNDSGTAGGISRLLGPTCIPTPAVSFSGDWMMYKSLFKLKACKCGCGNPVNLGKLYVRGHFNRGRPLSEKQKAILRACRLGTPAWNRGIPCSEGTKQKIATANRGRSPSPEIRKKISNTLKGRNRSAQHRQHLSEALKGNRPSRSTRLKMRAAKLGVPRPKESLKKLSKTLKHMWQDDAYKEKRLRLIRAGMDCKPNRPEKRLRTLLNNMFPGKYKYVGDWQVWIGGKNPDFISTNGQKKIIELFGDFWHGSNCTGMLKKDHREKREAHFARFGYDTLVIWEHELNKPKPLKWKLIQFHKR